MGVIKSVNKQTIVLVVIGSAIGFITTLAAEASRRK
ncbi:MAG: hypothetical protein K0R00_28 [Herbinix sp.]|jgi:hypothetical protein|nr:hypothetical protein [Herbinix sp.]